MGAQLALAGFRGFKREFCAIPGRRFRWDFADVDRRLLVEVQGGTWVKGAHSTGQGIARDTEKLNIATIHGWKVMQFTPEQVRDGRALRWVQEFYAREAA